MESAQSTLSSTTSILRMRATALKQKYAGKGAILTPHATEAAFGYAEGL